jgi:hypothetical protein
MTGLGDRLVRYPELDCDRAVRHAQRAQSNGFAGDPLVGERRARLKQRESQRNFGGGSNWLRSRPLKTI